MTTGFRPPRVIYRDRRPRVGGGCFIACALLGGFVALLGILPSLSVYAASAKARAAKARIQQVVDATIDVPLERRDLAAEEKAYGDADRDYYFANRDAQEAHARAEGAWVFIAVGGGIAVLCILLAILQKMR